MQPADQPTSKSPSQPTPPAEDPQKATRYVLAFIMGGVLIWGSIHAVGAYMYNHDVWRAVVVMASVLLFLGFWLAMLSARARRIARRS
jgi:VIT1/CCC1 family predicted Fe2+/Mn2+ transporter